MASPQTQSSGFDGVNDDRDTKVTVTIGPRAAFIGFSDQEWSMLADAWPVDAWPYVRLPDAFELFRLMTEGFQPLALILRSGPNVDPARVADVLSGADQQVPFLVVANSAMESAYLAPALRRPAVVFDGLPDAGQLALAVAACRLTASSEHLPSSGTLEDELEVATLLISLLASRFTGKIKLRRQDTLRTFSYRDGRIAYATSHLLGETLGRYLLSQGIIDDIQYQWARKLQGREGIRQGEALIKIGVLTPAQLHHHLHDHIRAKVVNVLVPGTLEYALVPDASPAPAEHCLDFDAFGMIVEGLHRTRPAEQLSQWWRDRARTHMAMLPFDHALREEAARWFGPAWPRVASPLGGLPADWFADGRPERERIAAVDALVVSGLACASGVAANTIRMPRTSRPGDAAGQDGDSIRAFFARLDTMPPRKLLGLSGKPTSPEVEAAFSTAMQRWPLSPELTLEQEYQAATIRARLRHARSELLAACADLPSAEDRAGVLRKRRRSVALAAEDDYQVGLEHLRAERFTAAFNAFGAARQANPDEPTFALHEGWCRCLTSSPGSADWEEGKQFVVKASRANPLMPMGLVYSARLAQREGRLDAAVELARQALALDPGLEQARDLVDNPTLPLAELSAPPAAPGSRSRARIFAIQDVAQALGTTCSTGGASSNTATSSPRDAGPRRPLTRRP